ncbi:hypothetical protein HELRODRAFT_179428 [Helobdella robusta]|uniref:RING-type domain-containing protein n=1 Tax=Helobdella robusta TaxID=6412 RepID=T1FEP3_HELRO|nr:hypothetical protein HELRODRAFT_179428 [Helobdella robusta]ESN95358.1 hypothetical protein HELRODRAFT_179428 [Helobdella robusta]
MKREIWICPICKNFLDRPKMFKCCRHTFCYRCLERFYSDRQEQETITCPNEKCNNQESILKKNVRDLPDNLFLKKLVELKTIRPRCLRHDDYLRAFCINCKQLACHTCSMVEHSKHQFVEIFEAADNMKYELTDAISKKKLSLDKVNDKLNKINQGLEIFNTKFKSIQDAIKQSGEDLKKLIDERVADLITESESIKTENLNQINPVKDTFMKHKRNMEAFICDSNELLNRGTSYMILNNVPKLLCESQSIEVPDYNQFVVNFGIKFSHKLVQKEDLIGSIRKQSDNSQEKIADKSQIIQGKPILLEGIPGTMIVKSCFIYFSSLYCGLFSSNEILVYHLNNLKQLKFVIEVGGLRDPQSIVATCNNLFISESLQSTTTVYKIDLFNYKSTKWTYSSTYSKLSVTEEDNLLMTCMNPNVLLEISLLGETLKEIQLDSSLDEPRHAIKIDENEYVVCHQGEKHRVCLIDSSGSSVNIVGGCSNSVFQSPNHLIKISKNDILIIDSSNVRTLSVDMKILKISRELKFDQPYESNVFGTLNVDKDRMIIISNNNFIMYFFS